MTFLQAVVTCKGSRLLQISITHTPVSNSCKPRAELNSTGGKREKNGRGGHTCGRWGRGKGSAGVVGVGQKKAMMV